MIDWFYKLCEIINYNGWNGLATSVIPAISGGNKYQPLVSEDSSFSKL